MNKNLLTPQWTPTPEPEWDPDFDLPEWKPTEDAPPAPAAAAPAFQSNNPFRRAGSGQPPPPPPPPPPRRVIDNDEEEQLRHALELSKAGDRDRAERERSVRASAPPPSPGPGGTAASGTTSDELALSVARLPAPPTHQPKDDGREDADLTRAIQESLMTASFHSTASNAENIPPPQPRTPGA